MKAIEPVPIAKVMLRADENHLVMKLRTRAQTCSSSNHDYYTEYELLLRNCQETRWAESEARRTYIDVARSRRSILPSRSWTAGGHSTLAASNDHGDWCSSCWLVLMFV